MTECPAEYRSWDDPRRWLGIGDALSALDKIDSTHMQLHYCVRRLQAERLALDGEIAAREQQLK